MINRRKELRHHLPLDVHIFKEEAEHQLEHVDISSEGTCIGAPFAFDLDDYMLLNFVTNDRVPAEKESFALLGRVKWIQKEGLNGYRYGVQFRFFNDPFSAQQKNKFQHVIQRYNGHASRD